MGTHYSQVTRDILTDFLNSLRQSADLDREFLVQIESLVEKGDLADPKQVQVAIIGLKERSDESSD